MEKADPLDPGKEQDLRTKILSGSQDLRVYRALVEILMDSGRENETLAVLEKALDLPLSDIDRSAISAQVAWILYGLGRTDRAITMAKTALTHVEGETDLRQVLMIRGLSHATLAACHYYKDRTLSQWEAQLAIESFERLLNNHPDFEDFALMCRYAAGVYAMQEEYAKAIALYEQAIRGAPSKSNRLYCLLCIGRALCSQGQYAQAERRLREALELVEADAQLLPRVYFELGRVQRLSERPEVAVESFEQAMTALGLGPHLPRDQELDREINWELGNLYYDAGRFADAIAAFRNALPGLPEPYPYFDTLISLGHCYLIIGHYERARECYDEVLASEKASKEEKATAQDGLSRLPPLPPPRIH